MRDFIPRPWQYPMVDFCLDVPRCQLLARMGLGKSSAVLSVLATRLLTGTVDRAVAFAPLRVARSTWPEEAQKWRQFAHLRVQHITWTPREITFLTALNAAWKAEARDEECIHPQTKELRRKAEALRPAAQDSRLKIIENLDLLTVHYDIVPQFIEIIRGTRPFQMGIADEASRLRSFRLRQGGRRARALSETAHSMPYWLNLSGAICPNGLENLWGPAWFIDKGQRLGRTFDSFESRWFGYQRAQDAVNAHKTRIKRIAFPHAQKEIVDLIKDVSLAFNPKDWFDIKDPIVVPVYVELPPDARKRYREMEKDLFTTIGGHDIEVFAASAKMLKTIQMAAGCCYTGSDEEIEKGISHWVPVHDEKLDALESIIEENDGETILVAYHFKPDLARLKKRFPHGRHITTKKDEDDFKAGKIRLAFGHPQSIGHGVDGFQNVCHIVVFFVSTFDLDPHDQLIERVGPMRQMQSGMNREVVVYMIIARGTIDELIAERLVEKRGMQDATMDSLAYRKEVLWA